MDEAHKELVKRLRERTVLVNYGNGTFDAVPNKDCNDAADALEAMAAERDEANANAHLFLDRLIIGDKAMGDGDTVATFFKMKARAEAAETERDRMKEALDKAGNPQLPRPASAYVEMREERDRMKAALEDVCAIAYDHGSIAAIAHARKALGDES